MDIDYLRGVEQQQERDYTQLKREYVAVLGKLIVAKAELEQTRELIQQEIY